MSTKDKAQIAEEVARLVESGSLPPDSCVKCSGGHATRRTLFAIRQRANRRWGFKSGGMIWGILGGIPFLLPTSPNEASEIREGVDLVVPIPLRVCDHCWQDLNGGQPARILAFLAQGFFLAALVRIVVWFIAAARRVHISFAYPAFCLIAAIPFYLAGEFVQVGWPRRIRRFLRKVPEYAALFETYPEAEIVMTEPKGLTMDHAH